MVGLDVWHVVMSDRFVVVVGASNGDAGVGEEDYCGWPRLMRGGNR